MHGDHLAETGKSSHELESSLKQLVKGLPPPRHSTSPILIELSDDETAQPEERLEPLPKVKLERMARVDLEVQPTVGLSYREQRLRTWEQCEEEETGLSIASARRKRDMKLRLIAEDEAAQLGQLGNSVSVDVPLPRFLPRIKQERVLVKTEKSLPPVPCSANFDVLAPPSIDPSASDPPQSDGGSLATGNLNRFLLK